MPGSPQRVRHGEEPGRLSNDPRSRRLAGSAFSMCYGSGRPPFSSDPATLPSRWGALPSSLDDIERLRIIKRLLYDEGYTIKGVQKLFKSRAARRCRPSLCRPLDRPLNLQGSSLPPPGFRKIVARQQVVPGSRRKRAQRRRAKRWPNCGSATNFCGAVSARRRRDALG